jgi:DNA-directed RNA polymerase subunit D
MDFTKIAGKGNDLVVEMNGVSAAQANTLRRLMMNEVPVLAVEQVEFKKNSSILYDEMLALRIGLIPLATDLGSYSLPSEEETKTGNYEAKSSVKGTLTAKGPCIVYSKDLKFKDPKVKPVYPEMPLVKLLEGQEVELTATAVLGLGRNHAKWSPGLIYYRQKPKLVIGDVEPKEVMKNLKGLSLDAISEKNGKLVVDEKKLMLAEAPDAYEDVSKAITLKFSSDSFVFLIESWGQLSPQQIIDAALDRMQTYTKEFEKLVKAL